MSRVFDRVGEFFASALENVTLQLQLREPGAVFFLHLLGCDTNGHVHKPASRQYRDNIARYASEEFNTT